MIPDPFFTAPRTTRPTDWFERILPSLPLRLPPITLPEAMVYHVLGPGGGVWTVGLKQGKPQVTAGKVGPISAQIAMTSAHFREAVTGALRERLRKILEKQGRPVELPDCSALPHDPARIAAVSALRGSLAFELSDRDMGEKYRYVLTLGDGPVALETADTTLEVDLDDLATLAAARTPPLKMLASGKLRVRGDADLPLRALTTLLGHNP